MYTCEYEFGLFVQLEISECHLVFAPLVRNGGSINAPYSCYMASGALGIADRQGSLIIWLSVSLVYPAVSAVGTGGGFPLWRLKKLKWGMNRLDDFFLSSLPSW